LIAGIRSVLARTQTFFEQNEAHPGEPRMGREGTRLTSGCSGALDETTRMARSVGLSRNSRGAERCDGDSFESPWEGRTYLHGNRRLLNQSR
jgi:hypothetical protein